MSKATSGSSSLWRYTGWRLAQGVPLIIAIIVLNFLLITLAPGDPVTALIGEYPAPQEYVERVRAEFGLDDSIPVRLMRYLGNVAQGNLGYSFANRLPVLDLVFERIARTLTLMILTVVVATLLGIALGILAARYPHSWVDTIASGIALIGYAVPVFWLGQIMILLFAVNLGWFPASGFRNIRYDYQGVAAIWDLARHMVLPLVTLSFRYIAITTRLTRASLLEVLNSDHVLAARARGLSEKTVLLQHALRTAALPIITVIGYNFAFIMAGSALVETVFAWPGVGRLMYDSIFTRDYPVLLGILLVVSITVIIVNLVTDLAYAYLDPRVRY